MKLSRPSFFRSSLLALAAACAAFFTGCITENQVKSIVYDANYQALLASTPGAELGGVPADGKTSATTESAAARINTFLETNPGDPVMAGTLRFRQALLYLNQHAFALADSAIAQVKADTLRSPRDRAIFAAYADLRWWSEYAPARQATFFASQKDAALAHMSSLAQQANALGALPDLRDYFLEMRAWIGVKLALASADPTFSRQTLQDAVDVWTKTFSTAELEVPTASGPGGPQPFDLQTRRVLRARVLLTEIANQTAGTPVATLTFAQDAVNKFYATLQH